jgi:hypothetical protein
MKIVHIVGLSSIVMTSALAGLETQIANIQIPSAREEQTPGAQQVQESEALLQKPATAPKFVVRAPKKLTAPGMGLMNEELRLNPTCTLRTESACNIARRTLKELPFIKEDKVLIVTKVNSLLSSLKQFFVQIHAFAFIIRPLLEESLLGDLQGQMREQLKKQSVLLGFLDSNAQEKDLFFEHRVQTKEALESVCAEFITFFGDLTENLSPKAKAEYLKVKAQFIKHNK